MSQTTLAFFGVSLLAALAYGAVFLQRPPSLLRIGVKVVFAAALALAARFADAPPLLALALGLCAAGDGLLAGEARLLAGGIVAFLVAHVAFIGLFLEIGSPASVWREWWRAAAIVGAAAWCGWLLRHLWPSLGALKAAGAAYALALLATVASALTLPLNFAWAIAGAALFLASDSILAIRLFRHEARPDLLWDHLVWWLYVAAIGSIAWSFLHG